MSNRKYNGKLINNRLGEAEERTLKLQKNPQKYAKNKKEEVTRKIENTVQELQDINKLPNTYSLKSS